MMRLAVLGVTMLALLAGCASVSREECLAGDWTRIGERDGLQGLVPDAILARHDSACARVDVTPDRSLWQQGYAQGLARYCTPLGGLEAGRAGRIYRDVCPTASEPRFLQGFELGRAAHRAEERVRNIEREISQLQARGREILGAAAADDTPTASTEYIGVQSQIQSLRLELLMARADLSRIEREIRSFRAAL